MGIGIKIGYKDELRRITVENKMSISELQKTIDSFGFVEKPYLMYYIDDEGDSICLSTDLELQEAFRQVMERKPSVLRINIEKEAGQKRELNTEPSKCTETGNSFGLTSMSQSDHLPIHFGVECNLCHLPIVGIRYKCAICKNFDLCESCEQLPNCHLASHPFIKIRQPIDASFERIHNITAALHACDDRISSLINSQKLDEVKESASESWNELTEQMKVQFTKFSEVVSTKTVELGQGFTTKTKQLYEDLSETTKVLYDDFSKILQTSSSSISELVSNSFASKQTQPAPQAQVQLPSSALESQATQPKSNPLSQGQEGSPTQHASENSTFANLLRSLSEMGFTNTDRNMELLRKYDGNIMECIRDLLDQPDD